MCYILELENGDKDLFYDLAAKGRNEVSQDLPNYLMDNEIVRAALRTAKALVGSAVHQKQHAARGHR